MEGLEKNKKQNYNNTNRIILFHFSNTDYIFTAICYVHRNVRMRDEEEEAEKPGVFKVINTAVNTSVSGYVMSFEFTQPASMYT